MNPKVLCVMITLVVAICLAGVASAGVGKVIKIEPGLKNLTEEQKTAVQLAQKFLKDKESTWGMPTKMVLEDPKSDTIVGKGSQVYTLYYPTPENEILLLSERGVVVNVATKKVLFVLRK